MRLYHTSSIEIREPDVHYGRKNADFGQGFYLTPDLEFARRWAAKDAVLNTYELDLNGLQVHTFHRGQGWIEYIFSNRKMHDELQADVVIGPIANDTIFDTFGMISSGFLTLEESLRLLQIGPEYTQVAIKTPLGASHLRWISTEQLVSAGKNEKEIEEYMRQFAAAMEEISGMSDDTSE